MLIKFILCVIIFSGCSAVGNLFAKNLEKRTAALVNLEAAVVMLNSRMKYYSEPVKSMLLNTGKAIKGETGKLFCEVSESMTENLNCVDAMHLALDRAKNKKGYIGALTKSDEAILADLFERVGLDRGAQTAAFDFAKNRIESVLSEAQYKKNQLAKLYKTAGMLIGALVAIIFI